MLGFLRFKGLRWPFSIHKENDKSEMCGQYLFLRGVSFKKCHKQENYKQIVSIDCINKSSNQSIKMNFIYPTEEIDTKLFNQ